MNVIPVIVNNKLFCMLRNGSFADLLNAEIITRGVQHKAYDLINAPSPYRKCKIAHIKVCDFTLSHYTLSFPCARKMEITILRPQDKNTIF